MVDTPHTRRTEIRMVFVCRGNQCRSPLAEHLTRRAALRRGLPVDVTSLGLLPGGLPMPSRGVAIAAEHGLDLSGHRSRDFDLEVCRSADLVVTMSREQTREIAARDPRRWPRIATLKQLTALAAEMPPARRASLRDWLASTGAFRDRSEMLGASPADDVRDPLGQRPGVWRAVLAEIQSHVELLLDAIEPTVRR